MKKVSSRKQGFDFSPAVAIIVLLVSAILLLIVVVTAAIVFWSAL